MDEHGKNSSRKMNTQRPNWTMQVVSEFAVVLAYFTILAEWRQTGHETKDFSRHAFSTTELISLFPSVYSFSPSPVLRFAYICQWLISEHWGGHNVTSVTTNVARAQRESAEIRHAALRMNKFSSGIPFPVTFLKQEQGQFC